MGGHCGGLEESCVVSVESCKLWRYLKARWLIEGEVLGGCNCVSVLGVLGTLMAECVF